MSAAGKVIAFTGDLAMGRHPAWQAAEAAGAIVSRKVTREVHYLVAGPNAGSAEMQARAWGIQVITEQQFCELVRFQRGAIVADMDAATAGMIRHVMATGHLEAV